MNALEVKRIVSESSRAYEMCWEVLEGLKTVKIDQRFTSFQPTLGSTLHALQELYNHIAHERRDLIRRKGVLNASWFQNRQRTLASYQQVIRNTIGIGRALGDAFAWFFYRDSTHILSRHFDRPRQSPFPTGTGGRGELVFTANAQKFGPYFVLHHACTSFLRVGDISLVDLAKSRVVGIGELKSRATAANDGYNIHAEMWFDSDAANPSDLPAREEDSAENRESAANPLPKNIAARLRTQREAMKAAVQPGAAVPKFDHHRRGLSAELGAMLSQASASGSQMRVIDPCLLVCAFGFGRHGLFRRLAGPLPRRDGLEAVPRKAVEIVAPRSSHNYLFLNTLIYNRDGRPSLRRGSVPLFWSDIRLPDLKRLYLRHTTAVTIFNPAPLLHRLEQEGFAVTATARERPTFTAERAKGGRVEKLEGLGHYFAAICDGLCSTEDVVSLILEAMERIGEMTEWEGARVAIDLQLRAEPGPDAV